ncbi:MAG: hypothetical protein AB8D78_06190 [Akkermansiaceae bacterium]
MLRFYSVFKLLVGLFALLFCLGLSTLGIALGGGLTLEASLELVLFPGPIGVAGILYAWSGLVLWKSLPAVQGKCVVLTGMAWGFCLIYCIVGFFMVGGLGGESNFRQPGGAFDEEVVMFLFIPTAILLLVAVEFVFLWRRWKYRAV